MIEADLRIDPQDGSPAHNAELTLTHLESLPTLPPVAVKVLELTTSDSSALADLVRVLRADLSLTAKLLAAANSASRGVREPVNTLEKAVVLLGFRAVRSLVLAVSVFECFGSTNSAHPERVFERTEFWKHALGTACVARRLAAEKRELKIEPEEAFVAGLLHDLGKVALDAVFPKAYDRIAAQADQTRGDIADVERAVLGVDHTVAGRRLAQRWGLPRNLQEVIWLHHLAAEALPSSVSAAALIAVVQLADTLVREQRVGYSGNHVFYAQSGLLAERLGLSPRRIEGVLSSLVGEVAQQSAELGLDRETPETLYVKSLAQANSDLGRLNAELEDGHRHLAASARYFQAIKRLDEKLSALSDLPEVVAAIADAAVIALQRSELVAFGLRERRSALDVRRISREPEACLSLSQAVAAELNEWLDAPGSCVDAVATRAPRAVRATLAAAAAPLGKGDYWLLPIVRDGRIAGGIVYLSEHDERARIAEEADELRSFLAGLGLTLDRANAQAAARRLSEDLAETNRRLQHMQSQLLRSRTLSMIAEMAAGAGHELNSPLAVISGRAQMLLDSTDDAETKRSLELIHNKAHECSRIVTELMNFAKPHPPRPTPVDVADLLAEVRQEWLERTGMAPARLTLDLADATSVGETGAAPLSILADREQIKIVLHEVLRNASDAIEPDRGRISLECRLGLSHPHTPLVPELPSVARPSGRLPSDWVQIIVRDDGCGMAPDVLQRAFDPFYSHRGAGRGRGLGLARAHRIVEAHGGQIWLESRPADGAAAHLVLPRPPVKSVAEPDDL